MTTIIDVQHSEEKKLPDSLAKHLLKHNKYRRTPSGYVGRYAMKGDINLVDESELAEIQQEQSTSEELKKQIEQLKQENAALKAQTDLKPTGDNPPAGDTPEKADKLEKKTVAELRAYASEKDITLGSDVTKKSDIIKVIRESLK